MYGNDDAGTGVRQSLLPAGDPLTPGANGIYYLGVSQFNLDPAELAGPDLPLDAGSGRADRARRRRAAVGLGRVRAAAGAPTP